MKSFLLFILPVIFLSSCQSELDRFKENAFKYGIDKKIDSSEFSALAIQAADIKDDHIRRTFYTGQHLDTIKFRNYLISLLATKDITLSTSEFWPADQQNSISYTKFNVNVYIENSSSMDGYLNDNAQFKDAVYSLLGDLSISSVCDNLNLHFINHTIPFTQKKANGDQIRSFIKTLTPETFRKRGGNRSSSDLRAVLDTVLHHTDSKAASVLISDFVFSPGKKNIAHDFLVNESIGIKLAFATKLQTSDLAVEILQLDSKFHGLYYDQYDHPIQLNDDRPYYIWFIGSKAQLKAIINSQITEKIQGGYRNKVLIQSVKNTEKPNFKILRNDKTGTFRLKSSSRGPITDAKPSGDSRTKGQFSISIAVDYGANILGSSYFSDPSNYSINSNYKLFVTPIKDTSNLNLKGFTHQLRLLTTDLKKETITVNINSRLPAWIDQSNSENDLHIKGNKDELKKTFGLKYLITGVFEAFCQKPDHNTISEFSFSIK